MTAGKAPRQMKNATVPDKPLKGGRKVPIKILLADDHVILREGLSHMLREEENFAVVAEGRDDEVVKLAMKLNPDVVIMEATTPGARGVEATREILSTCPGTKVIVLSTCSDKPSVLGMLRAGASAFLPKGCTFKELLVAVHAVASGRTYLSPDITGLVVADYVHRMNNPGPGGASHLTEREREVLRLIAEGRRTREIASVLGVSSKTIESHRRQIMEKLGLSTIAALVKYAIREGLASL